MNIKTIVSCHKPTWVYNKYTHERVMADCGHCPACQNRKHLRHVDLILKQFKLSKYAYFFTLTYTDADVPKLYFNADRSYLSNPELGISIKLDYDSYNRQTKDWLAKKSYVEVAYFKDIQDFIKRFRQNYRRMMPYEEALKQFEKYGTYEKISYYVATEYGPGTVRPHSHGIFFFDSDWLATSFEQVFFKSWSSFDRSTTKRTSKGWRSSCRPIDTATAHEATYTAAYCDSPANLPQLMQDNQIKARCSYSKKPLLGVGEVSHEEMAQFVYSRGIRQFDGVDKYGDPLLIRTPRAYENRYLPKCPAFSRVSVADRCVLYNLSNSCRRAVAVDINADIFADWLSSETTQQEIEARYGSTVLEVVKQSLEAQRPAYGLWLSNIRFASVRRALNLSTFQLVDLISEYYKIKEYYRLRDWYEFAENFSTHEDYRFLYSTYENALNSLPYQNSCNYLAFVDQSTRINKDGQKSKKDRDYKNRGNAVVFNP